MENEEVLIYIRDTMLQNSYVDADLVYDICELAKNDEDTYFLLNQYMKSIGTPDELSIYIQLKNETEDSKKNH